MNVILDDLSSYKKPLFSSSEEDDDDDDDNNQNGGDDNEAAWRKERHIRDSYLAAEVFNYNYYSVHMNMYS